MLSEYRFILPVTGNITDDRRCINVISYCRSMYNKCFAANHGGRSALYMEIQGSMGPICNMYTCVYTP